MSFPRLIATEHEIQQTRRICELRGWRYYSSTDARTDDAHVFDRAGREETLVAGRFTLEHVVMMLKEEDIAWGFWTIACDEPHEDVWAWFCCGEDAELLVETKDPHNFTKAAEAYIKHMEAK